MSSSYNVIFSTQLSGHHVPYSVLHTALLGGRMVFFKTNVSLRGNQSMSERYKFILKKSPKQFILKKMNART